jgi:site-specific recombinase XerD
MGTAKIHRRRKKHSATIRFTVQDVNSISKRSTKPKNRHKRSNRLKTIEVQGYKGLRAKDIHLEQRTITALSTKGCNPRPPMQISEELAVKLRTYIAKNNLKAEDYLFKGDARRYGEHYRRMRNRLAEKLNDPTIKGIRLYDLRHYYISKQLRKIQNAEFVRQIVGHKSISIY